MASFEEQVKALDFHGLMVTSIITALTFTVALFWRDAITATVDQFIPDQHSILFKFGIAIFITFLVGIIAYFLIKSQEIRMENIISIAKKSVKAKKEKSK